MNIKIIIEYHRSRSGKYLNASMFISHFNTPYIQIYTLSVSKRIFKYFYPSFQIPSHCLPLYFGTDARGMKCLVVGGVAGKRAAFAHNPMTSLARWILRKGYTPNRAINSSTVPPGRRFEGLLEVFQRTNQKARASERASRIPNSSLLAQQRSVAMPRDSSSSVRSSQSDLHRDQLSNQRV